MREDLIANKSTMLTYYGINALDAVLTFSYEASEDYLAMRKDFPQYFA